MFSIFKRKYLRQQPDFSHVMADMHSHLLPGIDDGSPDILTSAGLKTGLEDLGYTKFVVTPHIMWDLYKNTPETIGMSLGQLQASPEHQNIRAAAEYFLDDYFEELLSAGQPLLCITGKRVLVEFSFVAPPLDLKSLLFKIQISGYEPIIAHPERYGYFNAHRVVFDELKSMGCLFQLNLLSVAGYYGKVAQELAAYLLQKKYIDYIGTDMHHDRHLDTLRSSSKLMPVVNRLLDEGALQNRLLEL